ncbi:hypothetical protein AB1286_16110 [Trinickia sp. NRRL B-1857]|uniref:hypothetical protein n=1 Tax=Trinickia sp. NRRL B-1857 TaxID=3162879 RepID=UPI003D28221B
MIALTDGNQSAPVRAIANGKAMHVCAICFIALMALIVMSSSVHAADDAIEIDRIPEIKDASPRLIRALRSLHERVKSDAKRCIENVEGMDSSGSYMASIEKTIETKEIFSLRVSGAMICDSVHSSSYHYAVVFEKKAGVRIDLNRVCDIVTRPGDQLFFRGSFLNLLRKLMLKKHK